MIRFPFHALPKELLREGKLPFGAICLFAILLNETKQGRKPYTETDSDLAYELGVHRTGVVRYLKCLENAKLIRCENDGNPRQRTGIFVTWIPAVFVQSRTSLQEEPRATLHKGHVQSCTSPLNTEGKKRKEASDRPVVSQATDRSSEDKEAAAIIQQYQDLGWDLHADGMKWPRPGLSEGREIPPALTERMSRYRGAVIALLRERASLEPRRAIPMRQENLYETIHAQGLKP